MQQRSIVFWNLERLFEASGSPIQSVISGDQHSRITKEQINEKIATIGAVLERISEQVGPPILVGFVEIQSSRLVKRIVRSARSLGLTHVDAEAEDPFGMALDAINVSLLYAKDVFSGVERIRSHIVDKTFETRDILEVELQRHNNEPVSVFVNHWPSRLSAEGASKRVTAAYYLRNLYSSVLRFSLAELWNVNDQAIIIPPKQALLARARRPVIVMGDFNDEPFNASVEILRTTTDMDAVANDLKVKGRKRVDRFRSYVASVPHLINPFWQLTTGEIGTYYRSPRWRTYDQIMFSRGLIEGEGQSVFYRETDSLVFNEKSITRDDGRVVKLTNRNGKPSSFNPETLNGCSDHFPIVIGVNVE